MRPDRWPAAVRSQATRRRRRCCSVPPACRRTPLAGYPWNDLHRAVTRMSTSRSPATLGLERWPLDPSGHAIDPIAGNCPSVALGRRALCDGVSYRNTRERTSSVTECEGEELLPGAVVVSQRPMDTRCDRVGSGGADTAKGHAQVLSFDRNADALGCEVLLQPVGDLLGQPFLDLQVSREQFHYPSQFGQAQDPLAGKISDVGDAVERQQVVLTQ